MFLCFKHLTSIKCDKQGDKELLTVWNKVTYYFNILTYQINILTYWNLYCYRPLINRAFEPFSAFMFQSSDCCKVRWNGGYCYLPMKILLHTPEIFLHTILIFLRTIWKLLRTPEIFLLTFPQCFETAWK